MSIDLSKSIFLLIAPNSKEAIDLFELMKQNKEKLENKISDDDFEFINSNKELLENYFISSLKLKEREKIIKYLYKYKDNYDKNSFDIAIKNLLRYKYNVLIRQAVKSMAKKMLKDLKNRLIMELNDYPELNNEQNKEFIELIEGLYE